MKKLSVLLALVLSMGFVMSACDGGNSSKDETSSTTPATTKPADTMGVALDFSKTLEYNENSFFDGYEKKEIDLSKEYFTLLSARWYSNTAMQLGGKTAGSALTLGVFTHNIGQCFEMVAADGDYFALKSLATGLAVAVKDASSADGAELQLEEYTGADHQLWRKAPVKDGFYTVANKKSGKFIDVSGVSAANAAPLTQKDKPAADSEPVIIRQPYWEIAPVKVKELVAPDIADTQGQENWKKNAIKYPEEGILVPAGPIYLQWYKNDSIGDVDYYEIAFDDEAPVKVRAADATIMGYEWYNVKVAKHKVQLTAVLKDGTRVTTGDRTFTVSKKGIGSGILQRIEDMDLAWYYNWGTRPSAGLDKNLEHVPQIWGNVANLVDELNYLVNAGYKTVLGFNEPDLEGQANMTVDETLAVWPKFVASGLRLGSPCTAAPSIDSYNWFTPFMDGIKADASLNVDYIVMHIYRDDLDVDKFLELVDLTNKVWKKPIWITEFATANFSEMSPWSLEAGGDPKKVCEFMEKLLPELDKRDYVERYAWYPFESYDRYGGASALYDFDTGKLTELGELYKTLGLPQE